ncbi:DUF3817 domain-containing protein [Pilimelia columellifera]
MNFSPRQLFRIAAVAEAFTWLGLLVGMYLKYVTETTQAGVWLFGRLHGGLFVVYLAAALWVARAERWGWWRTLFALGASVPPLATVVFDRWLARRDPERPTAAATAG